MADKIKVNFPWNKGPNIKKPFEFASLNVDAMCGNNFGLLKKTEELSYLVGSGGLESQAKSLKGNRFAVFFLGEPRDFQDVTTAKLLCLSQKYNFPVIDAPDQSTAWNKIEAFLGGENVPIADFSDRPRPRLQNLSGDKFWVLDGTQGSMKISSLKYIDLYWQEREQKPWANIITEEGPKYRYYAVLYMLQAIPEDKEAVKGLKAACEQAGSMFRTTSEKDLRNDLYRFGDDIWKRFLNDIKNQFSNIGEK